MRFAYGFNVAAMSVKHKHSEGRILLAAWKVNFFNRAASGPLQRFTGKNRSKRAASRRFKAAQSAAFIQPAV